MKEFHLTFVIFILSQVCFSQSKDSVKVELPDVEIKQLNGKTINAKDFSNEGKPFIVCFWKTCCKPPVEMLETISEVYEDWVDETEVVMYAVSIDDSRNSNKVAPFVNSRGWEYIVLLDVNSDFKRAMNVVIIPHTFIFNGDGELVWQKSMFVSGDEELIYNELKKLSKDE